MSPLRLTQLRLWVHVVAYSRNRNPTRPHSFTKTPPIPSNNSIRICYTTEYQKKGVKSSKSNLNFKRTSYYRYLSNLINSFWHIVFSTMNSFQLASLPLSPSHTTDQLISSSSSAATSLSSTIYSQWMTNLICYLF